MADPRIDADIADQQAGVIDRMTAEELRAFIASTSGTGRLRGLLAYARHVQTVRVRSGNWHAPTHASLTKLGFGTLTTPGASR
jgi:hypothetical protein